MKSISSPPSAVHPLERLLAIGTAAACLLITGAVWASVSAFQGMWPFPALYLIEVVVLSGIAAAAFLVGGRPGKYVAWAAVGALAAFCVLGVWSVGLLYVPIAGLLAAILISYDLRDKQAVMRHVAVCLLAAAVQATVMLEIIRLI